MSEEPVWMSFNIHDILRIRTNILVPIIPNYFGVKSVDPDFELKLVTSMKPPNIQEVKRMVGKDVYELRDGGLFCEFGVPLIHMLGSKTKWRMLLESLSQDRTRITTAIPFLELRPIRFRVSVFLSKLCFLVMTIKLLRKGFALCHASSVAKEDNAYLFFGYSETGKSTIAFSLINSGYKYMADDHIIVDDHGSAYCYPEGIGMQYSLRKHVPIYSYLTRRSKGQKITFPIYSKAKVNSIFILERGKDNIIELDKDEAVRRLMLLNMEEILQFWNSPVSQIINYWAYFHPELNLEHLVRMYKSYISSLVSSAQRCVAISSMSDNFRNINRII